MKGLMAITAVGAAMVAGCSGAGTYSSVEPSAKYADYHVPDIAVATPNGRTGRLDNLRLGVSIVGFTQANPDGQIVTDKVLKGLADDLRFVDLPVAVVQVATPAGEPSMAARVVEEPSPSKYLVVLYDADGAANRAFLNPQPGQVFLVDWKGQIVAQATTDSLGELPKMAEQLGIRARDMYTPSIGG